MDRAEIEADLRALAAFPYMGTREEIAARMRTSIAANHGVPEEWVHVEIKPDGNMTVDVRTGPPGAVEINVVTRPL